MESPENLINTDVNHAENPIVVSLSQCESNEKSETSSDTSSSEGSEVSGETSMSVNSDPASPVSRVIKNNDNEALPKIHFRKVNLTQVQSESFLTLQVKASDLEITALLDTGARISLIKKSIVDTLQLPVDTKDRAMIYGIGGKDKQVLTVGSITIDIDISSLEFKNSKFQVVPDDCMDHSMFLGMDFLQFHKLSVNMFRRRIQHVDKVTGAKWELYVFPEGYKLMLYNLPCKSAHRISFNSKEHHLIKVPMVVECPTTIKKIPQDQESMYFYDGPLGGKMERYAQGVSGIIDIKDPFIYIKADGPGDRLIRTGHRLGTISTVVSIDTPTSSPVNTVQVDDFQISQNSDKIDLGDHLTPEQRIQVFQLLDDHKGVISKGDDDVGRIDVGSLEIQLYDHTPIYHRPRRFPDPMMTEIENQCKQLEAQDIIEPSLSSYNCRILPIRKPDGSLRLCMDYRDLNAKTVPDRFPMTNLMDSIYSLHGFKYFTSIDLVRGYYQMEVEENSRPYTAFSTSRGHWQYKRMPFGLKNAPSAFQRAMQVIFKDFPRNKVIIYLDDILIIEKDFKEHALLVNRVLNTLHSHGVKIKLEKCSWFKDTVKFLGHEVSMNGVRKHPSYIDKIKKFPKPETVKSLQEFMGLVNWQRKFVPQCAIIGKSLYAKTGGNPKSKITWTNEMSSAYEKLKEILVQDTQLSFPDYSEEAQPLQLYVDASATGAGACLCQYQENELKVILYDSHSFSDTQKRYSTIERELAAIRWGVKAFRPFLFGLHFKIYTDHQPLVYLHNMKMVDHRLARTLEDLAEYDFEILYTPGHLNQAADMLSRVRLYTPEAENFRTPSNDIPDKLRSVVKVPGGGNSMFASLRVAYKEFLTAREQSDEFQLSETELRTQIISDLINNPKRFGLPTDGKFKKQLRAMLNPEVLPVPEALVAFSERYRVMVCVHCGFDRPVIFKGFTNPVDARIHLQCLAGLHYNPLEEYKKYDTKLIPTWCSITANYYTMYEKSTVLGNNASNCVRLVDQDTNEELQQDYSTSLKCNHRFDGATARIDLKDGPCCALLDSGALVNLMSIDVFRRLSGTNLNKSEIEVLRGIGNACTEVYGTTEINIDCKPLNVPTINLKFLVVPSHILDTCILLGNPYLNRMDIDLDFSKQKIHYRDSSMSMGLTIYPDHGLIKEGCAVTSATYYISETNVPGISLNKILVDQDNCPIIRKVKGLVQASTPITEVPKKFQSYKRHWKQLKFQNGLLVKEDRGQNIPIISFSLLVDIVLRVHLQNAHIGSFKLLELLSSLVWSPSLRSVIRDACTSCSICQKNKTISRVKLPPTIKIETKAPFELVAMDLVSLPTTPDGYIGILVLVDHNTKWLAVAPIKNKRTTTIIDKLENQLFPGLIKLPTKILTDNGPEFNSLEFSDMAERLNITHIKTTAHKPSSNGAVERVNRTIIEFLRSLTDGPSNWKKELPKAVQTYNNTTHRETKLSPSRYIMTREHHQTDRPIISAEQRKVWDEGHPQYSSYKPGQSVLWRNYFKGRQNVNKFKHKYSGPYTIEEVHGNKVTYIIKDPDNGRLAKAHHSQLKPWRNPPKYIIDHLCRFPINMEKLEGMEEYQSEFQEIAQEQSILETRTNYYNNVETAPFLGFPNYVPVPPTRRNSIAELSSEHNNSHDTNSDEDIPELPITPIIQEEIINNKQPYKSRTMSVIDEVSESSSSTKINSKEDSSSSKQSKEVNLDNLLGKRANIDISETGRIIQGNVFDWDVSSVSLSESSTFSSTQSLINEPTCDNCNSILSLINDLELLCLDSRTKVSQENSYRTLSLVPNLSISSNESISSSSENLSGIDSLFKTRSLTNLVDFSGFTSSDKPNRTGLDQLADRLREISEGLANVKDIVLHNRKDGLDRVRKTIERNRSRMDNVRLAVGSSTSNRSSMKSPPFLRSRGRVLELEHVPDRPVEYTVKKRKLE